MARSPTDAPHLVIPAAAYVHPTHSVRPASFQAQTVRLRLPTGLTTEHLAKLLGLLGAFSVLMSGVAVWQHYQRRLRDARRDIAEDLIDKIPLGVVLLSRDGRIKYVNRETAATGASLSGHLAVGKLYSNAMSDLVEAGLADLHGQAPEDWIKQQMADVGTDGASREVRTASGATFLRITKRLKDGETLLLRRDVTEERRRMRQIQLLNEDLQEQIRIANATTEDLRAFAYATSHDLKAPTNTALMIAAALQEEGVGRLPDSSAELLSDLQVTLEGMQTLIEEVRAYTDAVGTHMIVQDVDLEQELRAAIAAMGGDIPTRGTQVSIGSLPSVRGSPGQLRTLLANLLDNAIKFRSDARTLEVDVGEVEAPEGFVGIAVRDNGIGIAPEHQERIFQLFQRLNPVAAFAGSGMGLAICQRIAINHGGRITVTSQPGVGSTFKVYLRKDLQ